MADVSKFTGAAKKAAGAAKNKAVNAAKNAPKDLAKAGAKHAGKKLDNKMAESSDLYSDARDAYNKMKKAKNMAKKAKQAAKLVKAGAKVAGHAARQGLSAFFSFIVSNPVGWLVGAILVVLIIYGADKMKTSFEVDLGTDDETTAVYSGMSDDDVAAILGDNCPNDKKSSDKSSSSGGTDSASGADSDWTTKDSTAYKTAKKVFDSWVDKGLSGAAAAGIVGWVNSEGGFAMIGRAEGHYGNDIKTNSIKYGVVPTGLSYYTTEAGGGIYQFTPYTKYAPLSSDDWEDADKMNEFVGKAVASGDWNASMDLSGKNRSFRQMAEETDPQSATLAWEAYERGNAAYIKQDQKKSDAQKAYDMFEGSKHKFDASKFESHFGKGDGTGNGGGNSSSSSSDKSSKDKCDNNDSKGGGKGWSEDGTGEVNYHDYQAWKPKDLPADLKEYALNPESMGMKYSDPSTWWWPNNQCTNLTGSLMHVLWQKDGQNFDNQLGNGIAVVGNLASKYGDKGRSKTPHAGSAFSSSGQSSAGHTGVVSHVFKNGDILIIEQNYTGYSGESAPGENCTYDYRYVTKSGMEKDAFEFYDPSAVGFTSNKDAKSQ